MNYLEIKLHVGNKRSKGDLTRVMNTHEEISEKDSGLPSKVRRKQGKLTCWKSGWIEEIDKKLKDRKIEVVENNEKSLVKTDNKFLMEHALECVNGKRKELKY